MDWPDSDEKLLIDLFQEFHLDKPVKWNLIRDEINTTNKQMTTKNHKQLVGFVFFIFSYSGGNNFIFFVLMEGP